MIVLNKHGVLGICFTDDSLALRGGNNLHQIMSRLHKVVSELEEWGMTCGLKFTASKTEVGIFTKSNIKQKDMPKKLQVSGQEVEFNSCAKYLGVTSDSKLNWNVHFHNQITKFKRYLFTIKKFVSKAWAPKPTYIRWIYTAVVRARLCYGAIAWGHSTRLKTRKDQLDKLNRLVATMITPVLYDLMPLHLFIQYKAIASIARNWHCMKLDWPGQNAKRKTYIGHLKYWNAKTEEINIIIDENEDPQH